jgi:hypothetical protein
MTRRHDLERLLAVLEGDRELLEEMERLELIRDEGGYDDEACERARVVRTLVRELEVNWAGVEIIIRMREDLLTTRQQLAEALEILRDRKA